MPEYDENGNEIPDDNSGSALRSKLEETLAENKRLTEEAEAGRVAQEELAFTRASLPESKAALKFREHYDGPLDTASIRAAAIEWGVVDETTPQAVASQQGQQQMAEAALGGYATPPPGNHEEMWAEFEKAVSNPNSMNPMQDGERVLARWGQSGEKLPTEMSRSGNSPQVVPISSPGYTGTPVQ